MNLEAVSVNFPVLPASNIKYILIKDETAIVFLTTQLRKNETFLKTKVRIVRFYVQFHIFVSYKC